MRWIEPVVEDRAWIVVDRDPEISQLERGNLDAVATGCNVVRRGRQVLRMNRLGAADLRFRRSRCVLGLAAAAGVTLGATATPASLAGVPSTGRARGATIFSVGATEGVGLAEATTPGAVVPCGAMR